MERKVVSVKSLFGEAYVVKKWKYNRDPDEPRIPVIAKCMDEIGLVEDIIKFITLPNDPQFYCWDGFHRYTALKLTSNVKNVVIEVTPCKSSDDIIPRYQALNSSVPTPLANITSDKLSGQVYQLVKSISSQCPQVFSASRKCRRPRVNRDALVEGLCEAFTDRGISEFDPNRALEIMCVINEKCSEISKKGDTAKMLGVCRNSGCWLFLHGQATFITQLMTLL